MDGSGSSDVDGDALTFVWSLLSVPGGSSATLTNPTAVDPSFVVDVPGTYIAQLIVNDGLLDSAADTVSVSTENSPPIADAGADQFALVGDVFTLDGSGSSDVDGDPLNFSWSIVSVPVGSTAQLSDVTAVNPSFAVDVAGTYVFQLIVNDGTVDSNTATVTIVDGPGPSMVTVEGQGGMKIEMSASGIEITNGQGATVTLQGPKTSINGSALEVT